MGYVISLFSTFLHNNVFLFFLESESNTPVKSKVDKVEPEKPNIDQYLEDARFFIMKSSNSENVTLSKARVSFISIFFEVLVVNDSF